MSRATKRRCALGLHCVIAQHRVYDRSRDDWTAFQDCDKRMTAQALLRVQLTLTLNMLTLTLDVVDQLLGGVGRLHFAFVPFDWLLKWSSCSR